MKHTNTVRELIDGKIAAQGHVSKWWVIETIRQTFDPVESFNMALQYAPDKVTTTSGIENIQVGAAAIFRQAMKSLSRHYQVDLDGRITRKVASPDLTPQFNALADSLLGTIGRELSAAEREAITKLAQAIDVVIAAERGTVQN